MGLVVLPFFFFCILACYGGVFFYSLVYYRILKRRNWITSIGFSLLWMIFYAMLATPIADVMVVINRTVPYVQIAIMGIIFIVPYILAIRLFIKSKHV